MPLRLEGRWRKRWRYVGAFDEGFMLCAAVVEVGPLRESFWALWDRASRRLHERTRPILPGLGSEVELDGARVAVRSRGVEIELELGETAPVECRCPSGEAWTWTRKRAGMPANGTVRVDSLERELAARGVDDESAGYHPRRTAWRWSAGVGRSVAGQDVAWNLVTGINDPETGSERAVWIDGVPSEPAPVEFDGLSAVSFREGSRLEFTPEAGRERTEGVPFLFRSDYEAPFGTFSGAVAGTRLAEGFGVMERHDALW